MAYISCSVIRLARFNVENEEDESAHMSFIGLPTPAAAGAIVSLILLHHKYQDAVSALNILLYSMPVIALGIALLMVSRIRYPHIVNQYFKGKKPFGYLLKVLLLFLVILFCLKLEGTLVLLFCGFALSSLIRWLYYKSGIFHLFIRYHYKSQKENSEQVESHPELH